MLRLKPDHAVGHYNLGVALEQQGQAGEAAACYQRALAIDPIHLDSWNNLGCLRKEAGDLEKKASDSFKPTGSKEEVRDTR